MRVKFASYRGKHEGQKLEFKGRDSVDDARTIPRAVCAMLNADGGEVLVGVKDDGHEDPLDDPLGAERAVHDKLISTISPSLPKQLKIERFDDAAALRIVVPAGEKHALYAVKSTEGRFFVPIRSGARTQNLDWLEIRHKLANGASPTATADWSPERVRSEMATWIELASAEPSSSLRSMGGLFVWLGVETRGSEDLLDAVRPELIRVVGDPETIGIDRDGWHFSTLATRLGTQVVRQKDNRLLSGDLAEGYRCLDVFARGGLVLRFATRLGSEMRWGQNIAEQERSTILNPWALSESISSCARLLDALLEAADVEPVRVWGALELTRSSGLQLPPHRPNIAAFHLWHRWPPALTDAVVSANREIDGSEFRERPDRLAHRLLTDVYRTFGHNDSAVPFWDREQERFVYR